MGIETAQDGVMANPDIVGRLGQFWIFEDFSPEELGRAASFVQEEVHPAGAVLFHQGDPPDDFYLVESGTVQEVGKDAAGTTTLRRTAEAGDFVGRRSLMQGTARLATATVTSEARLLVIRGDDFRTLLAMFPVLPERLERIRIVNRLLAIPVFGPCSEEQLFHVADLVRESECLPDQVIFHQGEPADAFYVIDTGQVVEDATGTVPGKQTWPKYLCAGDCFGRFALLNNTTRRATATSTSATRLFRFSPDAFHWLRKLCPEFEDALRRPDILTYLRNTSVFSKLTEPELKHLAGYVGLAHFRAGDTIYRQGEIDPTFYILYEGEAIIRARDERGMERPRDYLKDGDAVGETSLFLEEPRDVTVVSTTGTNWFYVTRQDLEQFLEQRPTARGRLVLGEEVQVRRTLTRFDWMDADEKVIVERRRHWIALTDRVALPLLALLVTLLVWVLLLSSEWRAVANVTGLVFSFLSALWVAWGTIDWLNDYYVVTTERVVHREKVLWIRERRDEAPLDKVQNVNIDRGFVGNLLGFGKLVIDTAAAIGVTRVTFDRLTNPESVQAAILEQMRRVRAGERLEARKAIQDKLETTLGTSIRPFVPRPAVPSPSSPSRSWEAAPIWRRVLDGTLGRAFWIEDRDDGRVVWRKHWIRLIARVWKPTLAALVGMAIVLVLVQGRSAVLVGLLLILVPSGIWWWWSWEDWRNDLYIVTHDRIIDTERLPLGFRSRRTETTFDKIQNASYDIPHPIATILDYGTVFIYTAGAEGRLDFEFVRDPRSVQAEIFRRLAAHDQAQRRQQREEGWEDLSAWFSVFQERRLS
jgi:CRP-like cAMP-binding protein